MMTAMATAAKRRGVPLARGALARALSQKRVEFAVDNPYTGQEFCRAAEMTLGEARAAAQRAHGAFREFARVPLAERKRLFAGVLSQLESRSEEMAKAVSGQMGKPLSQARSEVKTMLSRGRAMHELADEALAPRVVTRGGDATLTRTILREPKGVVLVLAPWNYPLLCAMNPVAAAVLAGCPVLLKHSNRTPLCADHFEQAFRAAGAPEGLLQALQISHADVAALIRDPAVAHVSFTGSVEGGHAVSRAVADSGRFIDVGLELGGNDAAYVAADADVARAVDGVVDGAFYNAGQSCCGLQRAYVHRAVYNAFVAAAADMVNGYRLGDPAADSTTLGPMAQPQSVARMEEQVQSSVRAGAVLMAGTGRGTADAQGKGRFFSPTMLVNCNNSMAVMREEVFGPVLAVQAVDSDAEAVRLINDSRYGLTAAVYTSDAARAGELASQLDVGTVFMNRCDFVDPYLPWSGRKDSGKGAALSQIGFDAVTFTKGLNFRR